MQHTVIHCNTLQYAATHGNTHCNKLQHTASLPPYRKMACAKSNLQHTATHCNTLQHTMTHSNTLQHNTAANRIATAISRYGACQVWAIRVPQLRWRRKNFPRWVVGLCMCVCVYVCVCVCVYVCVCVCVCVSMQIQMCITK